MQCWLGYASWAGFQASLVDGASSCVPAAVSAEEGSSSLSFACSEICQDTEGTPGSPNTQQNKM